MSNAAFPKDPDRRIFLPAPPIGDSYAVRRVQFAPLFLDPLDSTEDEETFKPFAALTVETPSTKMDVDCGTRAFFTNDSFDRVKISVFRMEALENDSLPDVNFQVRIGDRFVSETIFTGQIKVKGQRSAWGMLIQSNGLLGTQVEIWAQLSTADGATPSKITMELSVTIDRVGGVQTIDLGSMVVGGP